MRSRAWLAAWMLSVACGGGGTDGETGGLVDEEPGETPELSVGELDDEGVKSDGWGAALNCKPIPNVPALAKPEIVISLDGLTLHLRDKAGSYDRVFPIGPGAIDPATGRSLTPVSTDTRVGLFHTSTQTREVADGTWGYNYPCRIWHTDDDGSKKPVFAGLPFIRLVGPPTTAYGIHGPVDAFAQPSGGKLRRGFVSHGCTRMAPEDIVEVYARIRGRPRVPVRIQKEVERDAFGRSFDVPDRWIGQECSQDSDCSYAGGFCRRNPYGRPFCTKACTSTCPDRAGYVGTRCVANGVAGGYCTVASDKTNNSCGNLDGRIAKEVRREGRSGTTLACVPGTRGTPFSPCLRDSECSGAGTVCQGSSLDGAPGFCSRACTSTCPGAATACTTLEGGRRCVPTCWGQDACGLGLSCDDGVTAASGRTVTACQP